MEGECESGMGMELHSKNKTNKTDRYIEKQILTECNIQNDMQKYNEIAANGMRYDHDEIYRYEYYAIDI